MVEVLVPIFICVIGPVSIVFLVMAKKMYADRQRSKIIIKAIEENNDVDTAKIVESLNKPQYTPLEILNLRLLRGCIFSLVGLCLTIMGIILLSSEKNISEDPWVILLLAGLASAAIGISYLIVYFVTRRQIKYNDNNVPDSEKI